MKRTWVILTMIPWLAFADIAEESDLEEFNDVEEMVVEKGQRQARHQFESASFFEADADESELAEENVPVFDQPKPSRAIHTAKRRVEAAPVSHNRKKVEPKQNVAKRVVQKTQASDSQSSKSKSAKMRPLKGRAATAGMEKARSQDANEISPKKVSSRGARQEIKETSAASDRVVKKAALQRAPKKQERTRVIKAEVEESIPAKEPAKITKAAPLEQKRSAPKRFSRKESTLEKAALLKNEEQETPKELSKINAVRQRALKRVAAQMKAIDQEQETDEENLDE